MLNEATMDSVLRNVDNILQLIQKKQLDVLVRTYKSGLAGIGKITDAFSKNDIPKLNNIKTRIDKAIFLINSNSDLINDMIKNNKIKEEEYKTFLRVLNGFKRMIEEKTKELESLPEKDIIRKPSFQYA